MQPLILSPHNSPSGTIHLMQSAKSSHLIVDPELLGFAKSLGESSIKIINTANGIMRSERADDNLDGWPDIDSDMDKEALATEAHSGLFAYKHTSGSTGDSFCILHSIL